MIPEESHILFQRKMLFVRLHRSRLFLWSVWAITIQILRICPRSLVMMYNLYSALFYWSQQPTTYPFVKLCARLCETLPCEKERQKDLVIRGEGDESEYMTKATWVVNFCGWVPSGNWRAVRRVCFLHICRLLALPPASQPACLPAGGRQLCATKFGLLYIDRHRCRKCQI